MSEVGHRAGLIIRCLTPRRFESFLPLQKLPVCFEEIQTTGNRFLYYLFLMKNDLKKYVFSYLKESLSDERYLDKLSNLILKHIAEQILKKNGHLVYKKDDKDIYQIYPPDFDIYKYTLNLEEFPENIKNWIENQGLRIIMARDEDEDDNVKGSYKTPKTIFLYYSESSSFLKDIWEMSNEKYIPYGSNVPIKTNSIDIYSKLYYAFHSTLLHELRHAFDDFRSKRKYLNTKRWAKYYDKYYILSSFDANSEESIKKHTNKVQSYLRLPHEINARFSQALAKTHFDKLSDDWESKFKKPFEDVLKDFKYNFEQWRTLTPKMQQWITKRLYKYWDEHVVDDNGLLKEYINSDVVSLKKYFEASDKQKKEFLPFEYSYFFEDFLVEENIEFDIPKEKIEYGDGTTGDGDNLSGYELIEFLYNNNKELFDNFSDYLFRKLFHHELPISDSEYPAWTYFGSNPEIIKNQWLIHFTNDAQSIAKNGFKYGVNDMTKLGLTTSLGEFEKKYGGYNFAYTLKDFRRYGYSGYGKFKYGKEAVVFNASGIKLWHHGDQEPQVIFYGNTAKNIIPITSGDNANWALYGKRGNVIYENDDLEKVVEWLVKNYLQYKNQFLIK